MTEYRIIEKKGQYVNQQSFKCDCLTPTHQKYHSGYIEYIPRFIVQEIIRHTSIVEDFKALKEFSNLEEARAYKRDLELNDGIVIE